MTDFAALIQALVDADVDFIIVGGVATVAHGSSRLTQDLDIIYSREPANLARLVKALTPYDPYLRGAPRGLPFSFDIQSLARGLQGLVKVPS
ncbi:MAG: hypothetical protein HYX75_18840 [Acidobacteria bacterium]|nr:hypothetical protein [Acidobacteriota bacterium]